MRGPGNPRDSNPLQPTTLSRSPWHRHEGCHPRLLAPPGAFSTGRPPKDTRGRPKTVMMEHCFRQWRSQTAVLRSLIAPRRRYSTSKLEACCLVPHDDVHTLRHLPPDQKSSHVYQSVALGSTIPFRSPRIPRCLLHVANEVCRMVVYLRVAKV